MYDFDLLEKKCKRYYLKKYLVISLPLLLLIVAAAMGYKMFFYNIKKTSYPVSSKIERKIEKKKTEKKKIVKSSSATDTMQTHNYYYYLQFFVARKSRAEYLDIQKGRLEKLGFSCYVHSRKKLLYLRCNQTQDYNKFLESKELAEKYKLDFIAKQIKYLKKPYKKIKIPAKVKKVTKTESIVKPKVSNNSEDTFVLKSQTFDIIQLKELFQERKSYSIAMKLAQYYYRSHKYKDSIVWAKRANSIDRSDADSWIVYAKSLYALGNKRGAKKILHIYLRFEKSTQVNKILSQWSNK